MVFDFDFGSIWVVDLLVGSIVKGPASRQICLWCHNRPQYNSFVGQHIKWLDILIKRNQPLNLTVKHDLHNISKSFIHEMFDSTNMCVQVSNHGNISVVIIIGGSKSPPPHTIFELVHLLFCFTVGGWNECLSLGNYFEICIGQDTFLIREHYA